MSEIMYSVAIGELSIKTKKYRKITERILDLIEKQEGYKGLAPVMGKGILILMDSLNHAKVARNVLESEGIPTDRQICIFLHDGSHMLDMLGSVPL